MGTRSLSLLMGTRLLSLSKGLGFDPAGQGA